MFLTGSANTLGAVVHLGGAGKYVHWGFIQISVANLIIIGVMIVMFVAALLLPFPGHRSNRSGQK
jgi:hypothetical protein